MIFVISAPSGCGKTTLIKRVRGILPFLEVNVSYTTRSPRVGEIDGRDYNFVDEKQFQKKVNNGDFVEWKKIFGNHYGVCKKFIDNAIKRGKHLICAIDVGGAMSLKSIVRNAVLIFIMPPSKEILIERLANRGGGEGEDIGERIARIDEEMEYSKYYDYKIVNDDKERCCRELVNAILKKIKEKKG